MEISNLFHCGLQSCGTRSKSSVSDLIRRLDYILDFYNGRSSRSDPSAIRRVAELVESRRKESEVLRVHALTNRAYEHELEEKFGSTRWAKRLIQRILRTERDLPDITSAIDQRI